MLIRCETCGKPLRLVINELNGNVLRLNFFSDDKGYFRGSYT
jgi:hypothetical protein